MTELELRNALFVKGWITIRNDDMRGFIGSILARAIFQPKSIRLEAMHKPTRKKVRIGGALYSECKTSDGAIIIGGTVIK